jgi:hypothetical protein
MKKTFTTLLTLLFVYTAFSQGLSETEEKNFHMVLDIAAGLFTGSVLWFVVGGIISGTYYEKRADRPDRKPPKGFYLYGWLIFVGISTLIFIL